MKISLYADGAVGFDGRLFASAEAAESSLRRHVASTPGCTLTAAFERSRDYEQIGKLIYIVQRICMNHGEFEVDAAGTVDPRPAIAAAARLKRLTFWGADDSDESLVRSVMDGRKTVTADTVESYDQAYGEFGDGNYAPGDLIEVYDLRQRLRCIIRATKVCKIDFGDIPEEVWRGESFSSAQQFRQVHIDAMPDVDLHDGVELVTLHFELVEIIAREG